MPKYLSDLDVDANVDISGNLAIGGQLSHGDGIDLERWGRTYVVNVNSPLPLLTNDGSSLPTGGGYRMTGHISGTGTEQVSVAVFWNENGTWYVNKTFEGGTSSNHIEFKILNSVPTVTLEAHVENYSVHVQHERIALGEGSGNDNLRGYFGADSYLSWLESTNTLTVPGKISGAEIVGTSLDISGNITSAGWTGDVIASSYLDSDTAHLSTTQTFTGIKTFDRLYESYNGTPITQLGTPSVRDVGLFDSMYSCKTDASNSYNDLTDLVFYKQDADGDAWDTVTVSDDEKRRFLRGAGSGVITSGIVIPHGTFKYRVEFHAKGYTAVGQFYLYSSYNGNPFKLHMWAQRTDTDAWEQKTSSDANVAGWPGHTVLPFSTIWFQEGVSSSTKFDYIRLEFTPSWNHASNDINLYHGSLWGGYPAGRRTQHYYDQNDKIFLPGDANIAGAVQASSYKISDVTVLQGSGDVTIGSGGATGTISLTTHTSTPLKIENDDSITISSNVTVGSNSLTAGSLDINAGAITTSGDIISSAALFRIKGAGDVEIHLDDDNNSLSSFAIKDGANNSIFTLAEAGNATFAGTIDSGAITSTGHIKAQNGGNIYVYDDDDDTKIHIAASSNATEGVLKVNNGSNYGLIARGVANSPRLGTYHTGSLNIYGFGNSSGVDDVNDDLLAQFDFANEKFLVNGEIEATSLDADNITSTANSGDASIYINSTRPTLGFTDSNSFTDVSDIYLIRGGTNILQFQWHDNSAATTTETFNITSVGDATFAGNVTAANILTVAGAATGSPFLQFTQGGTQKAYIQYVDSGDSFELQSDDQFVVRTGGTTTALTINSSQNATFAGTISSGAITSTGKVTNTIASTHVSGNITAANAHLDLYNNWESDTDQKGSIITFTDNYYSGSSYNKTTRAAIKGGTDTVGNTADGYLEFYTDSAGADSPTLALRLDKDQNATFAGDVTVSGGDITLGGTGRIQGIDTVTDGTDAANKTYVDTAETDAISTAATASEAYTDAAIATLVDSAPGALDTLNELATALGDDANFSTTVTNSIATKVSLTGDETVAGIKTFTSTLKGTPANANTNSLTLGRTDNSNYWNVNHAGDDFRLYNTAGSGSHILLGVDAGSNVTANNVGVGTATPGQKLDVVGNIAVSGTVAGIDIAARDAVLTSTTTTAGAALPKAGGDMTGAIAMGNQNITGAGTITGTTLTGTSLDINGAADISGALTVGGDTLKLNSPDNGGAPANTAIFNMHGYEQRAVGIQMRDNVNSAAGSTNAEWFVGTGYNQSGFSIGYSETATQTTYAAQNKFSLSTGGNGVFAGTIGSGAITSTGAVEGTSFVKTGGASTGFLKADGSVDSNTYVTGAHATDFVSAANGGTFGGNVTVGSNSLTAGSLDINGDADISGAVSIGSTLASNEYSLVTIQGRKSHMFSFTGNANHTLTLNSSSYYQAEVTITAHQTNAGAYNNIFIRGIWSNNYETHHWDELERVGSCTNNTITITNGQNGSTAASGQLAIVHGYVSGASFGGMTVNVIEHYGASTHAIS